MADGMNDIVEKVMAACAEVPDFSVHSRDRMYEVVNDDTKEVAGRYPDRDMASRVSWQCGQEGEAKAAILAVLDAIAEPSEAMVIAARQAEREMGARSDREPFSLFYRAMVAALRKEIME